MEVKEKFFICMFQKSSGELSWSIELFYAYKSFFQAVLQF